MRRATLLTAALVALALPALADARKRQAPIARLMVEAREFNLVLSRPVLRAGTAIVQLAVRGEDAHDLRIMPVAGGEERAIPETRPGRTASWRGTLGRGRWRLFCSLPGHEAAGMRATVRVR